MDADLLHLWAVTLLLSASLALWSVAWQVPAGPTLSEIVVGGAP